MPPSTKPMPPGTGARLPAIWANAYAKRTVRHGTGRFSSGECGNEAGHVEPPVPHAEEEDACPEGGRGPELAGIADSLADSLDEPIGTSVMVGAKPAVDGVEMAYSGDEPDGAGHEGDRAQHDPHGWQKACDGRSHERQQEHGHGCGNSAGQYGPQGQRHRDVSLAVLGHQPPAGRRRPTRQQIGEPGGGDGEADHVPSGYAGPAFDEQAVLHEGVAEEGETLGRECDQQPGQPGHLEVAQHGDRFVGDRSGMEGEEEHRHEDDHADEYPRRRDPLGPLSLRSLLFLVPPHVRATLRPLIHTPARRVPTRVRSPRTGRARETSLCGP